MTSNILNEALSNVSTKLLVEPASKRNRFLAGCLFWILMFQLSFFCSWIISDLFDLFDLSDPFALKQLRTMIRMILIENVEEGVLAAMELMQELPISDILITLILPRLLTAVLLTLAALPCEDFAKATFGLWIVERDDSSVSLSDKEPEEKFIPASRRLWQTLPPLFFVLEWIRLFFGVERRSDILKGRRVVQERKNLPGLLKSSLKSKLEEVRDESKWRQAYACVLILVFSVGTSSMSLLETPRGYALAGGHTGLSGLGAVTVYGERVRASDAMKAVRAAESRVKVSAPLRQRTYYNHANQRIALDIDASLWQQHGLWYGAEFETPHGSAMLVGVDEQKRLWFAHDHSLIDVTPRLATYGRLSLTQLQSMGVVLREDRRLLGKAAKTKSNANTDTDSHDVKALRAKLELYETRMKQMRAQITAQQATELALEAQLRQLIEDERVARSTVDKDFERQEDVVVTSIGNQEEEQQQQQIDDDYELNEDDLDETAWDGQPEIKMIDVNGQMVDIEAVVDPNAMRVLNEAMANLQLDETVDPQQMIEQLQEALQQTGLDVTVMDADVQEYMVPAPSRVVDDEYADEALLNNENVDDDAPRRRHETHVAPPLGQQRRRRQANKHDEQPLIEEQE